MTTKKKPSCLSVPKIRCRKEGKSEDFGLKKLGLDGPLKVQLSSETDTPEANHSKSKRKIEQGNNRNNSQ